jgi:hypothetical protein
MKALLAGLLLPATLCAGPLIPPGENHAPPTVLLITSPELAEAWQPFADWKKSQGKPTRIVTTRQIDAKFEGPDIQEKIRRCVRKHVDDLGTQWIILGGDSQPGGKGHVAKLSNEDAYCADIALRVDPDGDHAIKIKKLRDKLAQNKISANWRGMLKAAVKPRPWPRPRPKPLEVTMKGGEADKFALEQSAVKGLVVVSLGKGKYAGAASSIVASAVLHDGSGKITFQPKRNKIVGPMMTNSLESVVSFLGLRHQDVPKIVPTNQKVGILFEDDDEFLDGQSSGTAMALLLDSLFTGDEIDQQFACTGGITPDGKVTRIRGVAAKIRGATRGQCTVVGVPEGNAAGVADILVLDGIDQLLDIQIFAMKDYEQAREISCRQKDAKVAATLEAFAKVAGRIRKEGAAALKSPAIRKQLEEVHRRQMTGRRCRLRRTPCDSSRRHAGSPFAAGPGR